jgi:hypothetical protein
VSTVLQIVLMVVFSCYSLGFLLFIAWASGRKDGADTRRKASPVPLLCLAMLPLVGLLIFLLH